MNIIFVVISVVTLLTLLFVCDRNTVIMRLMAWLMIEIMRLMALLMIEIMIIFGILLINKFCNTEKQTNTYQLEKVTDNQFYTMDNKTISVFVKNGNELKQKTFNGKDVTIITGETKTPKVEITGYYYKTDSWFSQKVQLYEQSSEKITIYIP